MKKKYNINLAKFLKNIIIFGIIAIGMIIIIFLFFYSVDKIEGSARKNQNKEMLDEKDFKLSNTGKVYYVSSNGVSNDGTDENNPMSLENALAKTYKGNDKVLLKCGDIFYGSISLKIEKLENDYFYLGSYGNGEKPIISGAKIIENVWNEMEDNIYSVNLLDVNILKGCNNQNYNVGFIKDSDNKIYGNRKKKLELLEKEMDFFVENGILYLKCEKNPYVKYGELSVAVHTGSLKVSSNMIIENLNIQDTGTHGISKNSTKIENVYFKNCIVQNIGGSLQYSTGWTRYGNGIEFWNQAENILIENCIIKNVYDAGITFQGSSVETGFKNIIIKNNIFIGCTYSVETFCKNDNSGNKNIAIGIDNCNILENISINQGRGWGYDVREDKTQAAELVTWFLLKSKTNFSLENNKYFNSRRIRFYYADKDYNCILYNKGIIDNNYIFFNKDTILINNNGNYQDRSILKEYNQDQDSTFKLLTDAQVQQISNPEILNSNDYNEIKTYYEEIEKEFEYTELKQETIEKYNNFLVSNETLLSPINNINNNINSIIGRIEDMTLDTTNEASLKEIINIIYSVESNIIGANVNKNITTTEMIKLINELNELAQNMDIIYSKVEISNSYDKNEITENIQESQNYINSNKDLEIDNLVELSKIGNEISNKEKTTYADYLYAITLSNWADNVLNTKIKEYITQNPVTTEYSETNITNKSVKATIKTNAEIQITNNSNSKEYVFEQNGSFTFEYTIKGQAKQITAKVTNIDKTSPIINGVVDGKLYTSKITPTITDENLDTIKLILNGEEVKNFKSGTTLTEEGFYTLTATDKAGNKTQISFQIMENNNQNYIIQDNIIKNISEQTIKSDFDNKLKLEITYKIARNDEEINEKDNIATGDILTTSAGDKYTLIVTGDLNKDGKLNLKDLVKMRKYLLDGNNLDENEMLSADCNFDGKINLKDLVKIRLMLLNQDATK